MKKIFFLSIIATITLVCVSFTRKHKTTNNQVMIYGIVYGKACNSTIRETCIKYENYLIDSNNSLSEKQKLTIKLNKEYPNSKRIRVETSSKSANNMCIIRWINKTTNCSFPVIYFAFGTTHQEAVTNAEKQKNQFADDKNNYEIVENKYW